MNISLWFKLDGLIKIGKDLFFLVLNLFQIKMAYEMFKKSEIICLLEVPLDSNAPGPLMP